MAYTESLGSEDGANATFFSLFKNAFTVETIKIETTAKLPKNIFFEMTKWFFMLFFYELKIKLFQNYAPLNCLKNLTSFSLNNLKSLI